MVNQPKISLSEGAKILDDIAPGPFKPNYDSFNEHCQFPQWLQDAKFGIWAHWGPQCVGGTGDHYAPTLYKEGDPTNIRHVQTYGHPSQFGFKDVCDSWKAEKWEPEALMALYKRAGARFFYCLGSHHDNFDNFNSKYQPWNSVKVGPRKDLTGIWAKAAKAQGLRFGVSVHSWQAWNYYAPARGADKEGTMAGIPYDGNLKLSDGKGKWWDGLDPQDLYAQNHPEGALEDDVYTQKFCLRLKDLVDSYMPDFLYFDNYDSSSYGGDLTLKVIAHYYNKGMKNGKCDVAFTKKHIPAELRKGMLWDVERGLLDAIQPHPWQVDTCIGNWHYQYDHKYRTTKQVIHMLVDIVSKNGNMLLNIPVKGDGSIDLYERWILEDLAKWFPSNEEAIFATRPWKKFGEGMQATDDDKDYSWNENKKMDQLDGQIRFTTKGGDLFAIYLGTPVNDKLVIRSLAKKGGQGKIHSVSILGTTTKIKWEHTENGLQIILPMDQLPANAFSVKINGDNLVPV